MIEKRRKIKFQTLIDSSGIITSRLLQVWHWMLKTSKDLANIDKDYADIMDQTLNQYSANSHDSYTDLGKKGSQHIKLGFMAAIIETSRILEKWRAVEKVYLDGYRYIKIIEDSGPEIINPLNPNGKKWVHISDAIELLYAYEGRELMKNAFCMSSGLVPSEDGAYIKKITFGTIGSKWGFSVRINWTTISHPGGGWTREYNQNFSLDREYNLISHPMSIERFLGQIHEILHSITMPPPRPIERPFNPDWVSPPGATIKDVMDKRGWNEYDASVFLCLDDKSLSLLLIGEYPIGDGLAERLAEKVGSTKEFWLKREKQYRNGLTSGKKTI